MDPKEEEAMECVTIAEGCIRKKDFSIARNLLNQAEGIFSTQKAKDLLRLINTQQRSQPSSQPPAGSEMNRGPPPAERRPTKTRREDDLPSEIPAAKKQRESQDTSFPGFKQEKGSENVEYTEEDLIELERIVWAQDYYNILNLKRDASDIEISKAHDKLRQHLSNGKGKYPEALEALNQVAKAFEILGNPEKKRQFDQNGIHFDQPSSGGSGYSGGGRGGGYGRGGYDNQRGGRGGYDNQRGGRGGYDNQRGGRGGYDNQRGGRGGNLYPH
jgi:hypothetical protein